MILTLTSTRLEELAQRADNSSLKEGDYFARSARFLRSIKGSTRLTTDQHNWLSALRAKLEQPWE